MDSLIEQVRDELPEADANRAYQTLNKILGNIVDHPKEAKFRSIQKSKLVGKLNETCFSLLEACGFQNGDTELTFPEGTDLEAITSSREILACLTLSLGEEPASPSLGPAAAGSGAGDVHDGLSAGGGCRSADGSANGE